MSRDYNTGQARRRRNQSPPWLWFFAGLAVGAVSVGLISLKQPSQLVTPTKQAAVKNPEKKAEPKPTKTKEQAAPKPRFDFYTVLPEMEVVIPEEEIRKPAPPTIAPKSPSVKNTSAETFLLQMGSFRNYKDADRLKASLALLNIEADIQSVTIGGSKGQNTFHRVRSGPYSRNQAQKLHTMLTENKVNSIIIRIKK